MSNCRPAIVDRIESHYHVQVGTESMSVDFTESCNLLRFMVVKKREFVGRQRHHRPARRVSHLHSERNAMRGQIRCSRSSLVRGVSWIGEVDVRF